MPNMRFVSLPSIPQSAPAFRSSFPPSSSSPSPAEKTNSSLPPGRTTIQVRRRSALGQSMLFADESDDEKETETKTDAEDKRKSIDSFSSTDSEQEGDLKTPEDEGGPCQPLIASGATSAELAALGDRDKTEVEAEAEGKGRKRLSADELRKRLGRVAGGHVVQQQQEKHVREQAQPQPQPLVKAPPSVGLKHRPDPRKELGLRAAMGSYQERRRSIGHRRAQSSGSVDLRTVDLDVVEQELTISVPPKASGSISPSIQVTPASPELVRSLPLPLQADPSPSPPPSPTSPRRTASEPFGGISGPPSLEQIRKWAIKRDKPTIMIQETPLASSSAERAKARAALENLQPGGGIARRSRSAALKMTPTPPTINVVTPEPTALPARPPKSNFAPVRAFSLPMTPGSPGGGAARAAQAQSMMARLSMRAVPASRRLQMPGAGVGGTI